MKKQGIQRKILFIVELIAYVKRSAFYIKPSSGQSYNVMSCLLNDIHFKMKPKK